MLNGTFRFKQTLLPANRRHPTLLPSKVYLLSNKYDPSGVLLSVPNCQVKKCQKIQNSTNIILKIQPRIIPSRLPIWKLYLVIGAQTEGEPNTLRRKASRINEREKGVGKERNSKKGSEPTNSASLYTFYIHKPKTGWRREKRKQIFSSTFIIISSKIQNQCVIFWNIQTVAWLQQSQESRLLEHFNVRFRKHSIHWASE